MTNAINASKHYPYANQTLQLASTASQRISSIKQASWAHAQTLLEQMSLQEKLGQLNQVNSSGHHVSDELAHKIRSGVVGSVINEENAEVIRQMQAIALHESRLGIPLLIGRDVIHGYHTVFPIPLALAASWEPELAERSAQIAAKEASAIGINWTFSPMIDISRDARWGRIAESFGEDPYLCSAFSRAMVKGYQGDDLSATQAIAACAKHFVGYGASEAGRDYNTSNLSLHELRNVHMRSFQAASDSGVATFMTSFSDVNGVPVSANGFLLDQVLRQEWCFDGVVVSDWASVEQLITHGMAKDRHHAAYLALNAGVDMEMVSETFLEHGESLVREAHILAEQIDQACLRVLALKHALGLFENRPDKPIDTPDIRQSACELAHEAAIKSTVLLKNKDHNLPLDSHPNKKIALLGYLSDDPYEQLGTWIFDGDLTRSVTLRHAMQAYCDNEQMILNYHPVFQNSRDHSHQHFAEALSVLEEADHGIVVLGEESILSGEAHCRASTHLPGAQEQLIEYLAQSKTPITLIIMAGRPLILSPVLEHVDSLLYAWHAGCMTGPALCDLLFAKANPSAKLPISLLRDGGQVPLYYAIKNTGRPVYEHSHVFMHDFPERAAQTSLGMASCHMDVHFTPLFPFGYGLSYSEFVYTDATLSSSLMYQDKPITLSVTLKNTGIYKGHEIVQVYLNDPVASQTRPKKELIKFMKVSVDAQAQQTVTFDIRLEDLAFYQDDGTRIVEEGDFTLFVGANSDADLALNFRLVIAPAGPDK